MKDRPILFSGAMVRALLAGTKTQTRRAVALPRSRSSFVLVRDHKAHTWWPYQSDDGESHLCDDGYEHPYASPYGLSGDRLWVREAFRFTDPFDADSPARVGERCHDARYKKPWGPLQFEADQAQQNWTDIGTPTCPPKEITAGKLRPGMFMPRWASRMLLEVTEVRVERLQDISSSDALAEGATQTDDPAYFGVEDKHLGLDPRESYASLWDALNGAGAWAFDPWVWAVRFRVITPTFKYQYSKPDRAPHEDGYRG